MYIYTWIHIYLHINPETHNQVSENRQTLLFSATLPAALAQFARAGLRTPHAPTPTPALSVRTAALHNFAVVPRWARI